MRASQTIFQACLDFWGRIDIALSKVYDYLEFEYENNMQFNVDTTLRQLEMYIHFSADANAVEFYDKVKEALEAL